MKQQSTSPNHNNGMDMDMDMGIGIDSEDLLYEIFVRLPPISLARFKYVSKSWYSLISNLDFLVRHWNNNIDNDTKQRIDLLLLGPSRNAVDVIDPALSIFRLNLSLPKSISTNKDDKRLVLHNSCNGLLLYHQSLMPDYNVSSNNSKAVFYVCNPITQHYIKIPNIELKNAAEEDEYKILMIDTTQACIVFDPSISLAYKVIRYYYKRGTTPRYYWYRHGRNCLYRNNVLYVYSSETHSWKVLASFSTGFDFGFRSALVNGVFYWYTNIGGDCLCFDVEKEKVWFIPLPTKLDNHNRICLYFGECSGQLCLIEKYHGISMKDEIIFPCSFDIMELVQQQQEDQRQHTWRVKYHVNMDPKFDHLKQIRDEPLSIFIMHLYRSTTRNEEEEEEAMLMNIVGTDMVVSFNFTSNTFRDEFRDEFIVIPNIKHTSKLRGVLPYILLHCFRFTYEFQFPFVLLLFYEQFN